MSRQVNLSELTTQQITDLLWVLKGTPQAQALYEEYSSRPSKTCIALDAPDWGAKITASLKAEVDKPGSPQDNLQIVRESIESGSQKQNP
ncbi:MAG: hypothetical protein WA902_19980 [Thermosynechococcaceae cyanobacterium]